MKGERQDVSRPIPGRGEIVMATNRATDVAPLAETMVRPEHGVSLDAQETHRDTFNAEHPVRRLREGMTARSGHVRARNQSPSRLE